MELSKKVVTENIATLSEEELKILVVLGNSPVIAEILFESYIGKTLLSYGLTEGRLYSFLTGLSTISTLQSLDMTFEPVKE